jgi:hypothetical protein
VSRPEGAIRLRVVPISLRQAQSVVETIHRHHKPPHGQRFSLAVIDPVGVVRGVAIVGRPVARLAGPPDEVAEVSRVATDGTPNACSALLGAAARAAKALGYLRIQTYTLPEEGGASLRGSGWTCEGEAGGGQWKHTDGKPRRTDQPTGIKLRWSRTLNPPRPALVLPESMTGERDPQALLFGRPA